MTSRRGETHRGDEVHVLVAEDSPTQAELLRHLLEEHGYQVTTAGNGVLALESMRARRPTLVVSDIVMPEMDGYALCRAIKNDPQLKDVPVVIVTSLAGIQDIVMALDCGADNFIRKPYEPHELITRIQYILSNRELRSGRGGHMRLGLEIFLGGKKHFITSEREQILDLLVASYEQAVRVNEELKERDQVISALNADLERHAAHLETANRELAAFSHSVSHDLRAPLVTIDGFTAQLQKEAGALSPQGRDNLRRVRESVKRMAQLIEDMLHLSKVTQAELHREPADLAQLALEVVQELRAQQPGHAVEFVMPPSVPAHCDVRLMRIALANLLGNAWKFTGKRADARVEFSIERLPGAEPVYRVRDNGAGFDMAYAGKLFTPFERLHAGAEFPGTGIGLATVQRIVERHRGRLWAEAAVGQGASFYFTLPQA
jgi:signal transduction histidine kinase